MATYGEYGYSNYTLLNPLVDEDRFHSVAYHEYTHFVLTCRSGVGLLIYCLEKIVIPLDSKNDMQLYKSITEFLNVNTNKVQEGLAVFVECIMILVSEGKQASQRFLDDLRIENETYYKYVEPLIFIIRILQDENDRNTILHISNLVFLLGIECMNSKMYELDPGNFSTNKCIKKIVSSEGFGKTYLPDKRFISYIKHCKMSNVKSSEDIEKYILPLLSEETVGLDIEKNRLRLNQIKKFILDFFAKSEYINAYTNKLSKVNTVEVDMKDLYMQQLPSTFNQEELLKISRKATFKELENKVQQQYCILFMYGSLEDTFGWVMDKVGLTNEFAYDKDYFQNHEAVMIFDLEEKDILMFLEESRQIQERILSHSRKATLVISYKNYDYDNDKIKNHSTGTDDVFIYCDRTYINATHILNKWNDRTLYYRYMTYKNMAVLIIKISDGRYFLLPMTLIVGEEADEDIRSNRKNMVMAAKDEDDDGFDDFVLVDQDMIDRVDLIINCLFFMSLKDK